MTRDLGTAVETLLVEALDDSHERIGRVERFSSSQTGVRVTDAGDGSTGYLRMLPTEEVGR